MTVRVHVNCAVSLDGCMGLPGPRPLALSSQEDLHRVHEMRAQSDAILVGIGTVLADDPKLTVKWERIGRAAGKEPLRVVLDARLRTPAAAEVAKPNASTVLFHATGARGGPLGVDKVAVPSDAMGRLDLRAVLAELGRRGVRTLMVEGGGTVISGFLRDGLVDELMLYVAPRLVGQAGAPRLFSGTETFVLPLRLAGTRRLGEGSLLTFVR